jgi:histone-lysine N-methyltransferase SETMAR
MASELATKNWLLHHNNAQSHTSFFTREFLIENNMTFIPHQPFSPDLTPCNFSLLPYLKVNLKGHHFNTTEVIEAEMQVEPYTLTEHNFQDAFKT